MNKREDEISRDLVTLDALQRLVRELKRALECSKILTPDSEGYLDSIKRWSDGVEKRAVRPDCIGTESHEVDSG